MLNNKDTAKKNFFFFCPRETMECSAATKKILYISKGTMSICEWEWEKQFIAQYV